jgi:Carboxypeptidase regulatory-like domain
MDKVRMVIASAALIIFMLGCAIAQNLPSTGVVSDYPMSLEGRVTAGQAVPGATVDLELQDTHSFIHTKTDDTGYFRFDGLVSRRPIPFVITVSKEGFETQQIHGSWPEEGTPDPNAMWPATKVHRVELKRKSSK